MRPHPKAHAMASSHPKSLRRMPHPRCLGAISQSTGPRGLAIPPGALCLRLESTTRFLTATTARACLVLAQLLAAQAAAVAAAVPVESLCQCLVKLAPRETTRHHSSTRVHSRRPATPKTRMQQTSGSRSKRSSHVLFSRACQDEGTTRPRRRPCRFQSTKTTSGTLGYSATTTSTGKKRRAMR